MEIKIFKKQKKFRKGGFHTNPNIGWQIIVVLAVGIAAGFSALGFYLFVQTSAEFEAPILPASGEKLLDKKRIDQALKYYADNAAASQAIIASPPKVVDPSN